MKFEFLNLSNSIELLFSQLNNDWLDPYGNKRWKLEVHLKKAKKQKANRMVSIGGAFSNHLLALSFAAKEVGIASKAFVKGFVPPEENRVLHTCRANGMDLDFVRGRDGLAALNLVEGDYFVPEGASDDLGIEGVSNFFEIQNPENKQVWVAAGTGGTAKGILKALPANSELHVVPVLKDASLFEKVNDPRLIIHPGFEFGGFAKVDDSLISFINNYWQEHKIPLDPIYNGKLFFAFEKLQATNPAKPPILVHTGGTYGAWGFDQGNPGRIKWVKEVFANF